MKRRKTEWKKTGQKGEETGKILDFRLSRVVTMKIIVSMGFYAV
jgi:hypothetical protein